MEKTENIIEEVADATTEIVPDVVEDTKIGVVPIIVGVLTLGFVGWGLYKAGEAIDKRIIKPIGNKIKANKEKREEQERDRREQERLDNMTEEECLEFLEKDV